MNVNKNSTKNVQATNESVASVQQLSSWLASNPTVNKNYSSGGGIRRGKNVVLKSRKFEQTLVNSLAESRDIEVGTVHAKQRWLQGAFGGSTECVNDKNVDGFKKSTAAISKGATHKMAHDRMFDQLRCEQLVSTIDGRQDVGSEAPLTTESFCKSKISMMNEEEDCDGTKEERETEAEATGLIDAPCVNFGAAQQLLIQRSKQNGNNVHAVTQVDMRKMKFEHLFKEEKKRCDPYGMMKRTWRSARPTEGPSTGYKRALVGEVAPKKTLADLP